MIFTALEIVLLDMGVVTAQTATTGSGQAYPSKSIRIITQEVGGSGDFMSRQIALGLTGPLGQPVIVDNRPTRIAREIGAKAAADGYSLYQDGSAFWLAPFLEKMPYDPVRDYAPISLLTQAPNVLVVHPSVTVKSVSELIALAKAKPGVLNYASAVSGSASHLSAELFKSMGGVTIVRVPYQGNAPALTALMSGESQILFASAGAVTPQLKSDRLRALAVTSSQPSSLFPGLPTIAGSGLPGFEYVSSFGIFVPAKTPAPVITLLNREIVRVITRPEIKQRFFGQGLEVVGSTPDELAARVRSEITSVGKVIKDAGIKPD